MDNLNDILIFTKVVEQNSFTAAAKILNLPKSSVSKSVSRLEKYLNARLLQRTTRRINLTEVGRRYYEYCNRIVLDLEEAREIVASYQEQPSGLFRLTAPYILGQAFLGKIVAEFLETYPQVQLQVELSQYKTNLIEKGVDLAIRVGTLEDSSLIMSHLGKASVGLFASPNYLEKHGAPQTPYDLKEHSLFDTACAISKSWRIFQGNSEYLEIPVDLHLVCNDVKILLDTVKAHQGIAALPKFSATDAINQAQLRPVLPDWTIRKVDINALYPSHKNLSPAVHAFVDLARKRFRYLLE